MGEERRFAGVKMLSAAAVSELEEPPARETSLAELLARANHLLCETFEEEVKGHGLSSTEWRVLDVLVEREGIAMTELAELVMLKQPTLTKAIDRMEDARLVQRRTPPEDRRRTLVYLTERGRAAAAPLVLRARQHEARLDDALGAEASRELKNVLAALIERLTQLPREARPHPARTALSA